MRWPTRCVGVGAVRVWGTLSSTTATSCVRSSTFVWIRCHAGSVLAVVVRVAARGWDRAGGRCATADVLLAGTGRADGAAPRTCSCVWVHQWQVHRGREARTLPRPFVGGQPCVGNARDTQGTPGWEGTARQPLRRRVKTCGVGTNRVGLGRACGWGSAHGLGLVRDELGGRRVVGEGSGLCPEGSGEPWGLLVGQSQVLLWKTSSSSLSLECGQETWGWGGHCCRTTQGCSGGAREGRL